MASLENLKEDLAAESGPDFFEKLAEKLGVTARASTIFGEAVERDGVTVIPVARARWGLGGGSGRGGIGRRSRAASQGGGGGVIVEPVGFIEVRSGEARFRPISKTPRTVSLALAGVAIAAILAFRRRG